MEDLFAKATRANLRYKTAAGNITSEDLWDVSLPQLDTMAKAINKQLKEATEESFFTPSTSGNAKLQLAFDVVMYIGKVKQSEAEAAKLAKERTAKKAQLLELINRKENEVLEGKSLDDLRAELAQL